jgi:hypothetical protein
MPRYAAPAASFQSFILRAPESYPRFDKEAGLDGIRWQSVADDLWRLHPAEFGSFVAIVNRPETSG